MLPGASKNRMASPTLPAKKPPGGGGIIGLYGGSIVDVGWEHVPFKEYWHLKNLRGEEGGCSPQISIKGTGTKGHARTCKQTNKQTKKHQQQQTN